MNSLQHAASRRNTLASSIGVQPTLPDSLTAGGRIIYRLTHRSPETCNAIAQIAGIGREAR